LKSDLKSFKAKAEECRDIVEFYCNNLIETGKDNNQPQNTLIKLCMLEYMSGEYVVRLITSILEDLPKKYHALYVQLQSTQEQLLRVRSRNVGLGWEKIGNKKPKSGKELKNDKLSTALQQKREFTETEFDAFGIEPWIVFVLSSNYYVKSGENYFKPVGKSAQQQLQLIRQCMGTLESSETNKWDASGNIVGPIRQFETDLKEVDKDFRRAYQLTDRNQDNPMFFEINNSAFIHHTITKEIIPYLQRKKLMHNETRTFFNRCIEMLVERAKNLKEHRRFSDNFLTLNPDTHSLEESKMRQYKELQKTLKKDIEQQFGGFTTHLIELEAFDFFRQQKHKS
jgi:hypothetical protein